MWKMTTFIYITLQLSVHLCPPQKKVFAPKLNILLIISFSPFSPVFDLLPSSSQRLNPGALRPILTDPTLNELYVISTFKLQTKSSATIFGLYSSTDNSKYFEFTVMGRLNKGKHICRNHFLKNPLFLFQDLRYTFLEMVPLDSFFFPRPLFISVFNTKFFSLYIYLYRESELILGERMKNCLWPKCPLILSLLLFWIQFWKGQEPGQLGRYLSQLWLLITNTIAWVA